MAVTSKRLCHRVGSMCWKNAPEFGFARLLTTYPEPGPSNHGSGVFLGGVMAGGIEKMEEPGIVLLLPLNGHFLSHRPAH